MHSEGSRLSTSGDSLRIDGSAVVKSQKRSVACYRCHSQKIKCSGGKPCSRCRQAGYTAAQCSYANRDRKVRIDESYLEQLVQDSQELHARRENDHQAKFIEPSVDSYSRSSKPTNPISAANLVHKEVWFQTKESSLPVYINEAACIAFATRLCQFLRPNDSPGLYASQRNYIDDSTLASQAELDTQWPTLIYAQLLIKTALGHINPGFHLVLRKETLDGLKTIYQKGSFNDASAKCKYFALFAIGQVYSAPHSSPGSSMVPGTSYFVRALDLLRIIPERPTMIHIESLLLLAYFCQFLNRFNSAYLLIGNALRLGLSLGLNINMPKSQNLSPTEREHRVRIWWSIYILDRYWGSKSGFPIQIHDDDIHVDHPSVFNFKDYGEQFSEVTYQIAAIELAKITGCMMKEIYTQKKSAESFLKREQRILISLQQWINSLPESLRIFTDKANSKHTVLLHLQFNYCVVLAIRPVLLKFLTQHQKDQSMHLDEESKHIWMTLSQACINAARYSLRLCLNEWTSGSLVIFGYAFPAFLFSSGLVLAIASLLPMGHNNDLAAFETSMEMLKVLHDSNNIAAKDLYEHSLQVQRYINSKECSKDISGSRIIDEPRDIASSFQETTHREALGLEITGPQPCLDDIPQVSTPNSDFQHCEFTTEMVLQGSMMQDFLSRPPADMGLLDLPEIPNEFDAAFLWLDYDASAN